MSDVLIVDDEEEICEYLCTILEEVGITAAFTLTGEKALELVEQESFKVFVIDMKLSTAVTGLELIKAIRQRRPQATVVAMSGYIDGGLKETALSFGAHDYLEKPADLKVDAFSEKMKVLLSKIN